MVRGQVEHLKIEPQRPEATGRPDRRGVAGERLSVLQAVPRPPAGALFETSLKLSRSRQLVSRPLADALLRLSGAIRFYWWLARPSPASDKRHLGGHHGHELHVGI